MKVPGKIPGTTEEKAKVWKGGIIGGEKVDPSKMQGYIMYIELVLGGMYSQRIKNFSKTSQNELMNQLLAIPTHEKDTAGTSRLQELIDLQFTAVDDAVYIHMPVPSAVRMSQSERAEGVTKGQLIGAIQAEFNMQKQPKAGNKLYDQWARYGIGSTLEDSVANGWKHAIGMGEIPSMDSIWEKVCNSFNDLSHLPMVIGLEDIQSFEDNVAKQMRRIQEGYGGHLRGYSDCGVSDLDTYVQTRVHQLWEQLSSRAASLQEDRKFSAEEQKGASEDQMQILAIISQMEDNLKSGQNVNISNLHTRMSILAHNGDFSKSELETVLARCEELRSVCGRVEDSKVELAFAIGDALNDSEDYLKQKLAKIPKLK